LAGLSECWIPPHNNSKTLFKCRNSTQSVCAAAECFLVTFINDTALLLEFFTSLWKTRAFRVLQNTKSLTKRSQEFFIPAKQRASNIVIASYKLFTILTKEHLLLIEIF